MVFHFLALIFTLFVVPAWASDFVVKLSTHNQFPYSYYSDDEQVKYKADQSFKGIATDVVRCAFDKMNQPYEILVMPWSRAQHLAANGAVDGFYSASQKDERDEFAVISKVIADQKWQWFWLKNNDMNINNPNFKDQGTIGGFRGANMLSWAVSSGYNNSVVTNDVEDLVQALLKGRMDVMIANKAVAEAILEKQGLMDMVESKTARNKPLSVYFTKDFLEGKPDFMDRFNQGVLACRPTF